MKILLALNALGIGDTETYVLTVAEQLRPAIAAAAAGDGRRAGGAQRPGRAPPPCLCRRRGDRATAPADRHRALQGGLAAARAGETGAAADQQHRRRSPGDAGRAL